MIRVLLPQRLRALAQVDGEVSLPVPDPVTLTGIIDAIEEQYPELSGTLRDRSTGKRRPLVRFFACQEDLSHQSLDAPLPEAIRSGAEPLLIVGAIAGG